MKIKRKLNIIGQKVKGKSQQVKGSIEDASGQHIKGTIDRVRGKVNVAEAEIKDKVEESK